MALSSSTCCRRASKSVENEDDGSCGRGFEQIESLWPRIYVTLGSIPSATSECKCIAGSKDEGKGGTGAVGICEGEDENGICHQRDRNWMSVDGCVN